MYAIQLLPAHRSGPYFNGFIMVLPKLELGNITMGYTSFFKLSSLV